MFIAGLLLAIMAADCTSVESSLVKAEHEMSAGDSAGAEKILDSLRVDGASCPRVLLVLGRFKGMQGMPASARDLLTQYSQRVPDDAEGHVALADSMLRQRDFDAASQELALVLKAGSNNKDALLLQARIMERNHQDTEAEQLLRQASNAHPADAETQFALGAYLDRHHLPHDAATVFKKVVAIDPHNSFAWDYLALNEESEALPAEAESAYRNGLAVKGDHTDSFLGYNYGRFLMKQNRLSESEKYLTQAVEALPGLRAPLYERAKLRSLMGDYATARDDAEKALQSSDGDGSIQAVQVYALLASIYARLGQTEKSKTFAELARYTRLTGASGDRR